MLNRRCFLRQTGITTLGGMLLPSLDLSKNKYTNPGIQLYTVRTEMLKNAVGTLKTLAVLGIKQIESANSAKGFYYGLQPAEMKKICTDLGMTLRSGHVPLDSKWENTLDQAAASGQEYLICSSMPSDGQTVDNYKKVAAMFNKAGEEAKKRNIKFGYHNHDYEFEKAGGKVLYDILLDETDPSLVHMELDLGWVVMTGNDPLAYFKKYPGRFPLWHLKDMDRAKKESTEFGKGILPIQAIVDKAGGSGLKYFFIEQEEYTDGPIPAMKHNLAFLKKLR
ncbi:MAG: sugar phosphate isomerase/epimerase [Flavihumibacter sp.]